MVSGNGLVGLKAAYLQVFEKMFWKIESCAFTFAPVLLKDRLSRKAEGYGPLKP
ncbi:hypothetical protein [Flavipsychrobacter stenotrophus]|uniref:hypothetical protein n=1 Tax=Flavipsychrobacter stenotrophus TaxID=2077091 RepID=UPI0013751168|nr:hypothetical protein [Flavipsychrobacter stenotrophus]